MKDALTDFVEACIDVDRQSHPHDPDVVAKCDAFKRIVENHARHIPGERGYGASRFAVVMLAQSYRNYRPGDLYYDSAWDHP